MNAPDSKEDVDMCELVVTDLVSVIPNRPHTKKQKKNKKMVHVITTHVLPNGTLVGGCFNACKNTKVNIRRFAPNGDSHRTNGYRQNFDAAVAAFAVAWHASDEAAMQTQRALIEALRTQRCGTCIARMSKLCPERQACIDEWDRMRWKACKRQNGCANQACAERGMASWIAMQADHGENPKHKNKKTGDPVNLSDYVYWACNGGVLAMRKEAEQIHQWICGVCHNIEPTSNSGKEHDPEKLEQKKDETDIHFRDRKRHAKITFPKYEYVNATYKRGKKCAYEGCNTVCVVGNEAGMHLDHIVESTKRRCCCLNAKGKHKGPCHGCADKLFKRNGGVSGLANNHTKSSALKHTKHLLDVEACKCVVACTPCHIGRKAQKRARWDETPPAAWTAEWDEESVEVETMATKSSSGLHKLTDAPKADAVRLEPHTQAMRPAQTSAGGKRAASPMTDSVSVQRRKESDIRGFFSTNV